MTQSGLEDLAAQLAGRDPATIASAAAASLSEAQEICLNVLGEPFVVGIASDSEPAATPARPGDLAVSHPPVEIKRPSGDARRLPWFARPLLLHYLTRADGTPVADKWVSLRDLPDGIFYHTAYQGYSGNKLVRAFGNDVGAFAAAAQAAGGERLELGDAGFAFQALPRAPLAALYWAGEDEIPPKCSVLFDASASHYLPTDMLAVLGGALADRIIKQRR